MNDLAKKSRQYNPPIDEKYSLSGDKKEELRAKNAINRFVTDPTGSIYALTSFVPELFAALLPARYSRTELSARQLLWREFVASKKRIPWKSIEKGKTSLDKVFDFEKAESVAERILIQYGDDSVFELGGLHLFTDRISMLAAKIIEDARIGISPLEKSTRYVVYDQKGDDGDYSFFKDPKIMDSSHQELYLQLNRSYFDFYCQVLPLLQEYFKKEIPIESQEFDDFTKPGEKVKFDKLTDERSIKSAKSAYSRSIKSKACDVARGLLPISTLTNVGFFGNARSFGYMFTRIKASTLAECQMIADEGIRESKKVLPKFFDTVENARGLQYQEYLRKTEELLSQKAEELFTGVTKEKIDDVDLVELDKDPEVNIIAGLLYPYTNLPLRQIIRIINKLGLTKRREILQASLKYRQDRRHKPPRGFELAGYELIFDIQGNFGCYRDLQRHRMLTQQRQRCGVDLNYNLPVEFDSIGKASDYRDIMDKASLGYKAIVKDFPIEAQYVVPMAYNIRWYMGMNLREAFWLTELRSIPQGHFSYRTIAQKMFQKAQQKYPFLKDLAYRSEQYVNMEDYSNNLERMAAMQRIEKKLAEIDEKYQSPI